MIVEEIFDFLLDEAFVAFVFKRLLHVRLEIGQQGRQNDGDEGQHRLR